MVDFSNDREANKADAQDEQAYQAWLRRELANGNLSPAARDMPREDTLWQWSQYTGRPAPKF